VCAPSAVSSIQKPAGVESDGSCEFVPKASRRRDPTLETYCNQVDAPLPRLTEAAPSQRPPTIFQAVRTASGQIPRIAFDSCSGDCLHDWLTEQVTFLGIPFQNWMVVALALILIAIIINPGERR
jgi:hypothetical protein